MTSVFHSHLKIGKKLGNGHFGEVFLGEDPVHGTIAVKIVSRAKALPPEYIHDDKKWAERKHAFHAEGRFLSQAAHRNVVPVHRIQETPDGDSVQLCMAYCAGGSLHASYERGPMTLEEVRRIGTDVLMGLGAVHARGMLHRDIKPANILLDGGSVAKISDFGLVTDDLVLGYASQAGYYDHLAYEVWKGGLTSVRSDIWAFGMTLYRLLHGQSWYEEAPAPQYIVELGNFADTLRWLPHVPSKWRRVIRTMLRDNPNDRYQSAMQALNAMSSLPVDPAWRTSVTPSLVRWDRLTKSRRIVVEWTRHSPRKHEWRAWSEPVGNGRTMSLGGSNGTIGGRQAISELEQFFAG